MNFQSIQYFVFLVDEEVFSCPLRLLDALALCMTFVIVHMGGIYQQFDAGSSTFPEVWFVNMLFLVVHQTALLTNEKEIFISLYQANAALIRFGGD